MELKLFNWTCSSKLLFKLAGSFAIQCSLDNKIVYIACAGYMLIEENVGKECYKQALKGSLGGGARS
jgi:hypothetical protein